MKDIKLASEEFTLCDMDSIYLIEEWLTKLPIKECETVLIEVYRVKKNESA